MGFLKVLNKILRRPQIDSVSRGWALTAGVQVTEDTSMKVSALNRGVIYISSQIAKLPWNIKGRDNEQLSGSLSNLLDLSPNGEMNSMMFRLWIIQSAILTGNGYAEIERDLTGRPVALWPIKPENIDGWRDTSGKLYYRVMGGSIEVPGADIYLDPMDVFHIRNFHTKDGLFGQGLVAYAADVLGISLGADRMAGNLFGNGGIPSGVITVQGTLSDEAVTRIKESWLKSNGGRKSAGVSVLEEGAKFEPVNISPDALQFLESRRFGVVEISRFLGVPPTKLFDTTAATYSNIENSNLEVATDTLHAWAKMLEIEADIKILNYRYGGRRSELDLYDIFKGDMTTRSNYFSKMMQTASITPNEIRTKEGYAPYADGDRFFVAVNNFSPADRIDEIIDSQVSKNSDPKKDSSKEVVEEEEETLQNAAIEFLKRR
jgi:HK97 family phage portal protein